jgi:N6-L-threonylcarbamoyladenine synthase
LFSLGTRPNRFLFTVSCSLFPALKIDLVPTGLILGIESSCDETSAAIVRGGGEVLSNVVASQQVHSNYGGVVPELASREHLRNIVPVVRDALQRAGMSYADLDAIAVTEGPGLAGALLVGITFAKALALGTTLPLIGVNHLEGHIHAVLMDAEETFADATPLLALVVSGGHTHLYLATKTPEQAWQYRNVGKTLDDAAGEAYDKVAKLLGLPYPGGPWMDALAAYGTPDRTLFPFTQIKQKITGNTAPKLSREATLAPDEDPTRFDMSFSGLKTAVLRYVQLHNMKPAIEARAAALHAAGLARGKPSDPAVLAAALTHFDDRTLNLIASFQNAVVKNLTRQAFAAAEHFSARAILVSGGVSANRDLRLIMSNMAANKKLPIAFPQVAFSTDNAAMIAAAAWPKFLTRSFAPDTIEPTPQLRLG